MQFSSSLKLNHIFRRLYRKGQSAANGYLVLYCRKNGSRQNRIGLTVSAKLAHAVQRNRLRRQLREIYRLHEAQLARTMRRWSAPIFRLPRSSVFSGGRRREAGMPAAHPPVPEVYLPGPAAPVPVFADLLAVCPGGDREVRRGEGRLAGVQTAAAV